MTKRIAIVLISTFVLLLIPFIAMQFTNEVNWSLFDFVALALLILIPATICELVLRRIKIRKYRFAICLSIIILFVLICIELAVGIF